MIENTKSKLESELEQIRSTTSHEASESSALKSRISSLEASHRDTLVLLESKTTAYEKVSQDLSAQHQKASELRKQIANLEQTVQSSTSALVNAKFKEQSLSQALELSQKNSDWLESELKTKQAEHSRFRQEKNAKIAELSRENELHISEAEVARRSEKTLKNRLEDLNTEFDQFKQKMQHDMEDKETEILNLRADVESANRLAELQKASAETAKERVQELTIALDEIREEVAEELGKARAEIDSERNDKEAAEGRVAELESMVRQLESEVERVRAQSNTPQRGVNGAGVSMPIRPSTPSGVFSPAPGTRLKGSMSMTQLYSAYKDLERELAAERRSKEQLQSNLDTMLQDLETNAPEIEELRNEITRLEKELVEMSTLAKTASEDRERAIIEAKSQQGLAESSAKECSLLKQQLRDVSAQVKVLLMEVHIRDRGQKLSAEEVAAIRKNAASQDISDLNATGQLISENLTVFRNISELEEQNLKIRSMLRDLGDRMEHDEAAQNSQKIQQLQEEVESLRQGNANLKDLLQSTKAHMKSFERERDMYRGMAVRKGPLALHGEANDFSRSLPLPREDSQDHGAGEGIRGSVQRSESEYAKLLKELQMHFDDYKREAATDQSSLRRQADDLSKRAQQLGEENIKTKALLASANHQFENLQSNHRMLKDELEVIRKSRDSAIENATQQQAKAQQVAEELVEMKGMLDGARREASNLASEKELLKNIESRLLEDLNTMRNERSRLDQLNASLQNLLNERDQSDSEARRRLSAQVDSLEVELQTTKRRLNEEQEENKKTSLRRDYEHEQSQKRIDDLVVSLGSTREELASVKTSRDHLQSRVDELTVELRSAEEKLAVLTQPPPQPSSDVNSGEDGSLSREQELAIELSEVKRDLELKTADLERASEQVQVYKDISQSSEERLQELSDANDQYREDTEATLAEKEKEIKDLQQRVEDISSELNTTNTELSQLRDQQSDSERRLNEQKASLEAEIARLRESEERHAEQAQFNLEASKAQAQIATEAQQNYEDELLKHAEAAKNLQLARNEVNELRLKAKTLETEAKNSQLALEQKEEALSDMKARYEQELTDLKTRREEALSQNNILHNQLDTLTKQISTLQRDRNSFSPAEAAAGSDSSREELQEVIKYLRREKEIIEVQYHLSSQDVKRLRLQLDRTQEQLDQAKGKIDKQRRAEIDSEQGVATHNKLMESLNELNLYRESNVTLRADLNQSSRALSEKTNRVEELETQIEPLKARIAELENICELREGEMKLLQEARDHWQQRTHNILSKYDRVDPAEIEALKEKVARLESERDTALASQVALQAQVDGIPEQVETARQELRGRLGEQFKARSKDLTGRIRDKQSEIESLTSERDQLQTELEAVKEELEQARHGSQPTDHAAVNGVQDGSGEKNRVEDTVIDQSGKVSELELQVSQLENTLAEKEQELTTLKNEQDARFKERENKLKELLNKRLSEVKKESQDAKQKALEELEERLKSQYQAELENVRAQSTQVSADHAGGSQSNGDQDSSDTRQAVLDADGLPILTDEQARALVQKNEVVKKLLVSNIRKRVDEKEAELRREFENLKSSGTTSKPEAVENLEVKFEEEKEKIIKEKEEEFQAEKLVLLQQQEEKLESQKRELLEQHQTQLQAERQATEKKIADHVALVEKRSSVKVSLLEGRAKAANAKLDVVKKAADETPQKPVIEVWEVAKEAKPPAAPPKIAGQSPTPSSEISSEAPGKVPSSSPGVAGVPTSPDAKLAVPQPPSDASTPGSTRNIPAKPPQSNAGTGPGALRQLQSGLPRGGHIRGRGGNQPASSHVQQSRESGENPSTTATHRGTGIPRGTFRGRGSGRAGASNVATNITQGPGRQSVSGRSPRGALNPNAAQFTPHGSKRALEDGGDAGNQGKRIRGASGGVP